MELLLEFILTELAPKQLVHPVVEPLDPQVQVEDEVCTQLLALLLFLEVLGSVGDETLVLSRVPEYVVAQVVSTVDGHDLLAQLLLNRPVEVRLHVHVVEDLVEQLHRILGVELAVVVVFHHNHFVDGLDSRLNPLGVLDGRYVVVFSHVEDDGHVDDVLDVERGDEAARILLGIRVLPPPVLVGVVVLLEGVTALDLAEVNQLASGSRILKHLVVEGNLVAAPTNGARGQE